MKFSNTFVFSTFFYTAPWGDDPISVWHFFFELGWIYHLGRGTRKSMLDNRSLHSKESDHSNKHFESFSFIYKSHSTTRSSVEASEHVIANTWRWFQIGSPKIPNIHDEHILVKSTGSEMTPNFLSVNKPTRLTSTLASGFASRNPSHRFAPGKEPWRNTPGILVQSQLAPWPVF